MIRQIFQLQIMIGKRMPELLTPPTTFYYVSVSCNRFSRAEMRKFGALGTDGVNIYLFTFRLRRGKPGVSNSMVLPNPPSQFSSFAVAVFKIFALRYNSGKTHRSDLLQSNSLLSFNWARNPPSEARGLE